MYVYEWTCVYVSGKVSVLTAKSSLHQGFLHCVFVVCVLKQPAERGRGWGLEHLHTVAQAFCLYTRLLPSNASRPSRLWPPRGSKGALPLKSQLCLILSACQIFHSPAVHLRSMVHNPLTSFYTAGESSCRFKRALSITPVSSLLLLPKQQSCPLTLCSELYGLGFSDICNIKFLFDKVQDVEYFLPPHEFFVPVCDLSLICGCLISLPVFKTAESTFKCFLCGFLLNVNLFQIQIKIDYL